MVVGVAPERNRTVLKASDKAPRLALQGDDGAQHVLGESSDTIVVYFYPKDDTPGCTTEAKEFSAEAARFAALGVQVFGISKDSVASHCKFRDKHGLTVRLLSDPDLKAHEAFGAYGEKTMYGRKVMGTIRSTFIVRGGVVVRAFPAVKVAGHVAAVLEALGGAPEGERPAPAAKANRAPKAAPSEGAPPARAKRAAAANKPRP